MDENHFTTNHIIVNGVGQFRENSDEVALYNFVSGIILLTVVGFLLYFIDMYVESDDFEESTPNVSLNDRMKSYELQTRNYVEKHESYIVRIDGSNFKAVSKRFKRSDTNKHDAFDVFFVKTMILTAKDLITKFNCSTIYVHSDEISLIFDKVCNINELETSKGNGEHIFGGSIEKIITEIPSYASVRFCHNLKKSINDQLDDYPKVKEMLDDPHIMFDGRIIIIPDIYEIANYIYWRSCIDCYRNCVSGYIQTYESSKSIESLSTSDRVRVLKDKHNFDIDDVAQNLRYGTFIKKYDRSETQTTSKYCIFSIKMKCMYDTANMLVEKRMYPHILHRIESNEELSYRKIIL